MIVYEARPYYIDRVDAGRKLAENLLPYRQNGVIVFAVPRGGIPVAVEAAKKLGSALDIVITRKIPIPYNTEAGYGAVTEDGAIVLNQQLVEILGLSKHQIERHADAVMSELKRRSALFRTKLRPAAVEGKTAIVIDDGLASGYTMIAAVKSLRQRGAEKVVAAAPVASANAWELVKPAVDEIVCPIVAHTYQFAVAGFYRHWHDLTDKEALQALDEFIKDYRADNEQRGAAVGKA